MSAPFEVRGVLEGFYGRPWSWPEREGMVDFLAGHGFNLYFYCPKNDPIHRNQWREPYLPEEVARFSSLAARCEAHGIEFVFGLSPLEFHYSDPREMELVWAKLAVLHGAGVRSFSPLLDDMPSTLRYPDDRARFGSLAGAQVWAVNTIFERLSDLGDLRRLAFCPTEYHGSGDSPYLRQLGEGLHPAVDVFWTGREVCSPTLLAADARVVGQTLRRKVLYWDNYPVNDLDMRFRAHIGPVRGREPGLAAEARGIVSAPGLQPEAHKIPLHTYAQFMSDPAAYEPEAAWERALLAVALDAEDARAVGVLGRLAGCSAIEGDRTGRLDTLLRDFWRRWEGEPEAALAGMEAELAGLGRAASRLLGRMSNAALGADLEPWSRKLRGWVEVGQSALGVLRLSLGDPDDGRLPALRDETLERIYATRANFAWVAGDRFDLFARRCLRVAGASGEGRFPLAADD